MTHCEACSWWWRLSDRVQANLHGTRTLCFLRALASTQGHQNVGWIGWREWSGKRLDDVYVGCPVNASIALLYCRPLGSLVGRFPRLSTHIPRKQTPSRMHRTTCLLSDVRRTTCLLRPMPACPRRRGAPCVHRRCDVRAPGIATHLAIELPHRPARYWCRPVKTASLSAVSANVCLVSAPSLVCEASSAARISAHGLLCLLSCKP